MKNPQLLCTAILLNMSLVLTTAQAADIDTWILAGQSNAEGYGITRAPVVAGLSPASALADAGRSDLLATNSSVRFFQGANDYNNVANSAGMPLPPRNAWHTMTPEEGLGYDWGSGMGNESGQRFGPELSFAHAVQLSLSNEIAIIKYARGSASLAPSADQFSGTWNDYDPSDSRYNQYDQLTNTVAAAAAALPGGDVLRIQGVLWMQGESDANASDAGNYEMNLTEFISALRSDLQGLAAASGGKLAAGGAWDRLHFAIGTIAVPTSYGTTVRAAQASVAAADRYVDLVNAYTDITLMTTDDWWGNGIHYDTAGCIVLGERFADAAEAGYRDGSDKDYDLMPDSWETSHFGNTNQAADADSDGDGRANLAEYIAGTDPTNTSAVVYTAGLTNGVPALQWVSVSNREYYVYWTDTLSNGFIQLGSVIDYPQNTYTDAVHAGHSVGYYDLRTRIKPETGPSYVPDGYSLVWADEFDGPSIDTSNWVVASLRDPSTGDLVPGAAGDHLLNTGYAGYITTSDCYIVNGCLVLRNQKRSYTGASPAGSYSYTSGWIMSMHRVFFNKGYIEFKGRFPSGDKVWPAVWLIAEDLIWGPEWDIFEYFGYRSDVGYDNMGMHLCYDEWPNEKWSSGWEKPYDGNYDCERAHVYGFEWTDTYAKWFVNGVEIRHLNNTFGALWPDEDMYIVLNNGAKSSSPDTTTGWPNSLTIDYIRLYQLQ